MRPSIRDLIPALVIFLFVACQAALLMEILIPALTGRNADSTTITALCGVLGACVSGLILLYLKDTASPPKPPESKEDPTIDSGTLDSAHKALRKYLDEFRGGKWRLGST